VIDFEALFSENRDFIFKYLTKLCKNQALAEELTQETFFRAYINLSSLREEEKAPGWLCRIARNAFFASCSAGKKTEPLEEADHPSAETAEDSFLKKELSQEALTCLHALEEPYKEVFLLAVFGEVSLKEISALFGKSESWARVTFYRAKQKLSERMR